MKRERLFYITDTLDSVVGIVDDLHTAGVRFNEYHVLSKDEDGLSRRHLHSASFFDRYDIVHMGGRGLLLGLLAGVSFALWLAIAQPFGVPIGLGAFLSATVILACFGTWVGGMIGLSTENYKIAQFHDQIEAGKYLVMIDTTDEREEMIREVMDQAHSEAVLGGIDDTMTNPFEVVAHLKSA